MGRRNGLDRGEEGGGGKRQEVQMANKPELTVPCQLLTFLSGKLIPSPPLIVGQRVIEFQFVDDSFETMLTCRYIHTVPERRMSHRKCRENKQQLM